MALPEELTPDSVGDWFTRELGYCDCIPAHEWLNMLGTLLEWCDVRRERKRFDVQFKGNEGFAYICLAALERAGLVDHGTAIRCPFLDDDGRRLLDWIRSVDVGTVWED